MRSQNALLSRMPQEVYRRIGPDLKVISFPIGRVPHNPGTDLSIHSQAELDEAALPFKSAAAKDFKISDSGR
jgi:hypothetical protein